MEGVERKRVNVNGVVMRGKMICRFVRALQMWLSIGRRALSPVVSEGFSGK